MRIMVKLGAGTQMNMDQMVPEIVSVKGVFPYTSLKISKFKFCILCHDCLQVHGSTTNGPQKTLSLHVRS